MGKHEKHGSLVGRLLLAALLAKAVLTSPATAACRLALALGHDVSGSVDRREYDLQLNGLARALENRDIQNAFLAIPGAPVRLYVYEWSGTGAQTEIIPWTEVSSAQDLEGIIDLLRGPALRPRRAETAVGEGLLFGGLALSEHRDCWRRTLDISADGTNNSGVHPSLIRTSALFDGVTVNALVVANDTSASTIAGRNDSAPVLRAYYRENVVLGVDAFIETAIGYGDYRRAIEKKLLKELATRAIGIHVPAPRPGLIFER